MLCLIVSFILSIKKTTKPYDLDIPLTSQLNDLLFLSHDSFSQVNITDRNSCLLF